MTKSSVKINNTKNKSIKNDVSIKENSKIEVKKRRKRRTKEELLSDPKNSKLYFTQDTEDAIIKYNLTDDLIEKNKLYEEHIKYPFEKLAENILNTFKFSYFQVGPLDVQKEVVSCLVSNINKFKEDKGKAFSYFSVIAKNYLILHNNSNYKNFKQIDNIDDHVEKFHTSVNHFYKDVELKDFLKIMIDYWEIVIPTYFSKKKEIEIAYAIVELFRKSYTLENFNKKAIYIYIREMTDCKTNLITKVINKMKILQTEIYDDYLNHGKIIYNNKF